jgi:hypothetical protein
MSTATGTATITTTSTRTSGDRYPAVTCHVCGREIRRAPHESYADEKGHICPECLSRQQIDISPGKLRRLRKWVSRRA